MNTSYSSRTLRTLLLAVIVFTTTEAFASHALFGRYSSYRPLRSIALSYTPKTDLLFSGTELTPVTITTPTFNVPELMTPLFSVQSGGHDDGNDSSHGGGGDDSSHGGGGHDGGSGGSNDSSGGHGGHDNDSTGHDGGNDSTGHHGDNDSTGHDGGTDSTGHHGNDDSTGHHDDDSTGHDGGNDSTGHHGSDDSTHSHSDTLDCGGHGEHHHGNNGHDSVEVNDSTERAMFGNQHQSIVIKSDGSTAIVTLQFTNDLTQAIDVTGLTLQTGANFHIAGEVPTSTKPVSLPAGGKLPITIVFDAADVAAHTDQLNITTNAQQATVSLEGVQVVAAGVTSSADNGVTISISPNPASNVIKAGVHGLTNVRIGVYTSNGTEVYAASSLGETWSWTPDVRIANGQYLVRIDGITSDGHTYSTTRSVILAR
ncbi:MAG: hypothetical protein JSS75_03240 [Bacteroidetes bacterium]|nr:hypothetical protein [Bacteroidota bacterium]